MKEIMSKEVIHMYLTLERLYSSNLRNCRGWPDSQSLDL